MSFFVEETARFCLSLKTFSGGLTRLETCTDDMYALDWLDQAWATFSVVRAIPTCWKEVEGQS